MTRTAPAAILAAAALLSGSAAIAATRAHPAQQKQQHVGKTVKVQHSRTVKK